MKLRLQTSLVALVGLLTATATPARCEDKVYSKGGKELSGTIDQITSNGIVMVGGAKEVASNIDYVRFDREPTQLSSARGLMKKGDFAQARAQLNTIAEPTRLALIEEIAFRKAYCLIQMAMPRDNKAKGVAYKEMNEFITKHDNSFHFYEGVQLVGDVLVAASQAKMALPYYDKLAKSRLPAYRMVGALKKADLLYDGGDFAAAKAAYEAIMGMPATDAVSRSYVMQGKLGYAACLAGMKEAKKALEITEEIIKTADPAAEQMHARAYNTLGKCYMNSGRDDAIKQALRAFLIVDIVYSSFPNEHAESLYYLQGLWNKLEDRANANAARAQLQQRYPGSSWERRLSS